MSNVQTEIKLEPVVGSLNIGNSLPSKTLERMSANERAWLGANNATVKYPTVVGEKFTSSSLSKVALGGIIYLFCRQKKILIRFIGEKAPKITKEEIDGEEKTISTYDFVACEKEHPADPNKKFLVWS